MAYSICIIGNSHTAAIKQAWQNRAPAVADGVTLTYFAARLAELTALVCRNGILASPNQSLGSKMRATSGGLKHIFLSKYDAFVLIGLAYKYNLAALSHNYGLAEQETFGPARTVISRNCFSEIVEGALANSPAMRFLKDIRANSDAPVLICPTPFRTDAEFEEERARGDARLSNPAFWHAFMKRVEDAGSAQAARYKAEIVWQDETTCAVPGFTRTEFTHGALRLHGPERMSDDLHMNEAYGFHVLTAVLKRLDRISDGRVLPSKKKKMRTTARKSAAR